MWKVYQKKKKQGDKIPQNKKKEDERKAMMKITIYYRNSISLQQKRRKDLN